MPLLLSDKTDMITNGRVGATQLVERRVSIRKVAKSGFDSRCSCALRVLKTPNAILGSSSLPVVVIQPEKRLQTDRSVLA